MVYLQAANVYLNEASSLAWCIDAQAVLQHRFISIAQMFGQRVVFGLSLIHI